MVNEVTLRVLSERDNPGAEPDDASSEGVCRARVNTFHADAKPQQQLVLTTDAPGESAKIITKFDVTRSFDKGTYTEGCKSQEASKGRR
ncbi:MAG: hypothetical protein ACLTDX_07425 [[Clostridium] innocuum]